jgi:hypothetical protein
MVAYAYGAQFPAETEKLVVFFPGLAGWEDVYNNPGIWHFRFNGRAPEALARGHGRTYFEHFWPGASPRELSTRPEGSLQFRKIGVSSVLMEHQLINSARTQEIPTRFRGRVHGWRGP